MSSNNDNTNEYLRSLVAQYLQQQQASTAGGNPGVQGNAGGGLLGPVQPPAPSVQAEAAQQQAPQQRQGDLDALMANFLKAASPSGAADSSSAVQQPRAAFANPVTLQQAQQLQQQLQTAHGNSGGIGNVLSQQILSSVERLAAINPALASAAVTQALSLQSQTGQVQGQSLPGLGQQGLGDLQPQVRDVQ